MLSTTLRRLVLRITAASRFFTRHAGKRHRLDRRGLGYRGLRLDNRTRRRSRRCGRPAQRHQSDRTKETTNGTQHGSHDSTRAPTLSLEYVLVRKDPCRKHPDDEPHVH